MKTRSKKVLVPVDFTEVSEVALKYAVNFARIADYQINLLHVIEKPVMYLGGKFDNQLITEETINKLKLIASKIETENKLEVEIIAKLGNIFETINEVSEEIGASIVVMGTHGVKGFQHVRGSNALRVINDSKVPFIVTQKMPPSKDAIENIVFPIDFNRESKEKAAWAATIAKRFNTKISIIYAKETDEFLLKKVNSNVLYTKNLFKKHEVKYNIKMSEYGSGDLFKDTQKYAEEIGADMIMIMTYPDKGDGMFFLTPDQQKVITNTAQIPVMCINPREDSYLSGSYRTLG